MTNLFLAEWRLLACVLVFLLLFLLLLLLRFIQPRAFYGARHMQQLVEARRLFIKKLNKEDVDGGKFIELLSQDFRHDSIDNNLQIVLTRVSRIRELFRLLSPGRQDIPKGAHLPSVAVCVTELSQIIGNMARRLDTVADYDYDLVPAHVVLSTVAEKVERRSGGNFELRTEADIEHWFLRHPISIEQVTEILIAVVYALALREKIGDPASPGKRQKVVELWNRPFWGRDSILRIIEQGEGKRIEFKRTLKRNIHTGSVDSVIEFEVFRAIAGFLNTEGGTVLVGVADDGEIPGYDVDLFKSEDRVKRYIGDKLRSYTRGATEQLVETTIETVQDKDVVRIDCRPSRTPVFLKTKDETAFFVRGDAATRRLDVAEVKDYIDQQFGP